MPALGHELVDTRSSAVFSGRQAYGDPTVRCATRSQQLRFAQPPDGQA
jgi:hypothetical protein